MGRTRRIDRREYEDYSPRGNKYNRSNKKINHNVGDVPFEDDLEHPDAERRWAEEYEPEELNPEVDHER